LRKKAVIPISFTAPVAFDLSRSHRKVLDEADFKTIELLFNELEQESAKILEGAQSGDEVIFERTLLMRFVGQGAEIDLSIEMKDFTKFSKNEIRTMFDEQYKRLYGRTSVESPVEFVTFKVRASLRASLPKKPFSISKLSTKNCDLQTCIKGERQAFSIIKKESLPFTVYDRSKLFADAEFNGPAIIEERESTIVMGEDAKARVDDYGFIWIQIGEDD